MQLWTLPWVEVVATVGISTVGVKFTGEVSIGVVGIDWAVILTLYLLLVGTLVLLFFCSDILGPGAFLVGLLFWGGLVWEGVLVLGCGYVWG